jgi:hypothetical protein
MAFKTKVRHFCFQFNLRMDGTAPQEQKTDYKKVNRKLQTAGH